MSTEISFEDGNLVVERVYTAPREAVFEAWIETSKVQQWWGCGQTTNVRSEVEPQVGGKYVHHMTIENVGEYPAMGRITEYDPPARLAFTQEAPPGPDGTSPPPMKVSVDFTETEDGTTVRLVHAGIPDDVTQYVQAGWTAAFEKLGKFLTAGV